jgi:hypothetical protein
MSDYTSSLPNGDKASFARRKCIFPNGMPINVQPAKDNPDDISYCLHSNLFLKVFDF